MADRYWVGGTGSWDGTIGSKWANSSGAAGGQSIPTTGDSVFFDSNSTGTVTIAAGNTGANSIDCTGFTGTLTGSAAISVAGSVTLVSGMTYTHTGTVSFAGTGTLITAGKEFSNVTINGSGITVTLGDAFTSSARNITFAVGTFDTANYNLTARSFNTSGGTKTVNLGSSTVTLTGTAPLTLGSFNMTFNAGTSNINLTGSNVDIFSGIISYYNVSLTNTSRNNHVLHNPNSFNNLTLVAPSSDGVNVLAFDTNQTINGTLDCTGTTFKRTFIRGGSIIDRDGIARTLTVASLLADNCDFRDITIAGGAAGTSPTRAGDCGGNSGITFPVAKTVYRVGADTTWPGSSSWALTSGGAGSDDNFPLVQDTIVIDENTSLTGTLNTELYNCGALDCSSRTTGITLNYAVNQSFYGWFGSHTLGPGVTVSGNSVQRFSGKGVMDFTSAGKTITFSISIDAPGGTFRLGDAFTSNGGISQFRGTFNANNYNLTAANFGSFISGDDIPRTVTMGSGLWTLTGTGSIWTFSSDNTNLTFNKDTADILLSNISSTNRTFTGSGLSYNKLTIGGSTGSSTTIFNSSGTSFVELASTKAVAHTITFSTNQGTIGTWSVTGTAGNFVTLNSNTVGTRRNFTLTNATSNIDYLDVKDIGETSENKFNVGNNSIDSGNNNNVYFGSPNTSTMLMLFL